jgi:hypothetical protein
VVSAAVVVAVAVPGVRLLADGRDAPDGFPLSTYPMFTRDPGGVVELPTVVAVGPGGEVERLSPQTIAGTDQVIQAGVAVGRAVRDGPAAAGALCREVAGRVDGADLDSDADPDDAEPDSDPDAGADDADSDSDSDVGADDDADPGAGSLGTRTIAVVVERHDALAWAAGDREPLDRRTVAECPVVPR